MDWYSKKCTFQKKIKMKFTFNIIFPTALIGLFLFSCQGKPKLNDEFRNDILGKMNLSQDTLKVMNQFLDQLDKRNTTFGDYYVKAHQTIQDSCYEVLKAKYEPDHFINNNKTDEDSEFLYQITVDALAKYETKMGLDSSSQYIVEWTTNSKPEIKRYLNQKYGLELYIPEDLVQDAAVEK